MPVLPVQVMDGSSQAREGAQFLWVRISLSGFILQLEQ